MALTIGWLLVVLFLSVIPTGGSNTEHSKDKIVHFLLYGITAVIFYRFLKFRFSLSKTVVLSVGLASFYGFTMELLQALLPWREFSFSDGIANFIGAFLFGVLYAIKENYRKA